MRAIYALVLRTTFLMNCVFSIYANSLESERGVIAYRQIWTRANILLLSVIFDNFVHLNNYLNYWVNVIQLTALTSIIKLQKRDNYNLLIYLIIAKQLSLICQHSINHLHYLHTQCRSEE